MPAESTGRPRRKLVKTRKALQIAEEEVNGTDAVRAMAQRSPTQTGGARKPAGRPKKSSTPPRNSIAHGEQEHIMNGHKRKDQSEHAASPLPSSKNSRSHQSTTARGKVEKSKPPISSLTRQLLDIFVFGEGSNAELGLGSDGHARNVKRPRLNHRLDAGNVGITALSCGKTHALAVSRKGEVWSWGSNNNCALGRDSSWQSYCAEIGDDAMNEASDDDFKLNLHESTPSIIKDFSTDVKIVKVAAGDSISLALTDNGQLYGWGCFRNQNGIMGFYQASASTSARRNPSSSDNTIFVQDTPRLYSELNKVVDIACGTNHAMALTQSGEVFVWGCGEQNQLGHHINERHDVENGASLVPAPLRTGRRTYKAIFSGNDHAFAIDTKNQVWAWGLNSFGQCGIAEGAGGNGAAVYVPTIIDALTNADDPVKLLCGGQHHSLAVTEKGRCLVWGRIDGSQLGLDTNTLPEDDILFDNLDRPRILIEPTPIPNVGKVVHAAVGINHTIVINDKGQAFSWGVSSAYQTGQGTTDCVPLPTRIENSAVRGKHLSWAGCGGQFSILASPAQGPTANGTSVA